MPGLAEHGRGFKDVADAIALRNRVLRALESAAARLDRGEAERDLGFVFVGAGYAGVEALAELHDLARDAVRRSYPTLRDVRQRWVLVDAAPTILPEIPRKLGRYTHRELERRGIEIHVVDDARRRSTAPRQCSPTATRIPARTLVWAAGVRPSPDLAQLGLPLDDRGRVVVDAHLRVHGPGGRWALGDCAAVPNAATPGRFDPPTCQHALRQARRLARNLTGPRGAVRATACSARSRRSAATRASPSSRASASAGSSGWFVARTYHLYALPMIRRKVRVVADWTVSLFFRRDIVELSALGRRRALDADESDPG